jgi:membrane associated rhomboid family serine protease
MTPWVRRLLIVNVVVFFVQFMSQTSAPGLFDPFVFVPAYILVRPWTMITYMFLHGGITHVLFNLLTLYFFGPRVEQRLGSSRFITLYFISGVSGALLSLLLAPHAAIIGASAAIFGVMLAYAEFWPRDVIYIWGILPVQARWLVIITTMASIYFGFTGSVRGVADFAHLGGYVGAFFYLLWLKNARGSKPFRARATALIDETGLRNWKKVDLRSVHEVNRDEVNRILDKISSSGMGSLTSAEKIFLASFVPPDDRIPPAS